MPVGLRYKSPLRHRVEPPRLAKLQVSESGIWWGFKSLPSPRLPHTPLRREEPAIRTVPCSARSSFSAKRRSDCGRQMSDAADLTAVRPQFSEVEVPSGFAAVGIR